MSTAICQLLYMTIVTKSILPFQLVLTYLLSWKLTGQLKWGSLGLKAGLANFCTILRYDGATNKIELLYELCTESTNKPERFYKLCLNLRSYLAFYSSFNQWPQSWLEWIVSLLKLNNISRFRTCTTVKKVSSSTVSDPYLAYQWVLLPSDRLMSCHCHKSQTKGLIASNLSK